MILWMLYSALVAAIVAGMANAADWLARLAGYRLRWIWLGALAFTVFLSATAALRGAQSSHKPAARIAAIDLLDAPSAESDASWLHALGVRVKDVRHAVDAALGRVASKAHRSIPPHANLYAALLSSFMSVGLAVVLVSVGRRFSIARRAWPRQAMHGVDVRIAERIGPVVVGLAHPEIVVPRWLLARDDNEQRLVVTHEHEHVRARDPLLLGFAWGVVVATPWSPALWYMLSRLRLAVELDCDARVLCAGAAPRSYGSLLIDVAQHASTLRLSALALADDSSHLHQRLLAMKRTVPRFVQLRGSLAATIVLAGLLIACQATLPTDAEIERMDVAAATRTARELAKATHADTNVNYTVNGVMATLSQASSLTPGVVDRVRIVTAPAGKPTQINIETRKQPMAAALGDSVRTNVAVPLQDGFAEPMGTLAARAPRAERSKVAFTGLLFIDGVRATEGQMRALDPKEIASVDVLKGIAAAQYLNDPAAANGVIVIKTKRGGAK